MGEAEGGWWVKKFLVKLRFVMAYTKALKATDSHEQAVHAGFTKLAEKPPFNVLSEADIKKIAPIVALIPDLPNLIAFVVNVVKEDNDQVMKDKWFLDQLKKTYKGINRQKARKRR